MDKGERTRAAFIDVAAELLQRQGLRATGVNQIIAESGAPRGSFYYHFPDGKDELACAALRTAAARWRAELQQFMERSKTPSDAVRAAFKALGSRLKRSDFRLGCPVATVSLELAESDHALREVCDEHFVAWESYLVELLREDGGDRAEAKEWAALVLSTIEGALLLAKVRRSTRPMRAAGDRLHAQLMARADAHRRAPSRRSER
jgi:TetR/AcrR family transcriptional repressor of lmrAB and yxaGH operons